MTFSTLSTSIKKVLLAQCAGGIQLRAAFRLTRCANLDARVLADLIDSMRSIASTQALKAIATQ